MSYDSIPESELSKRINVVKKWIVKAIPCSSQCRLYKSCKTIPKYKEILNQLDGLLQPRMNRDPREFRKKLWELSWEAVEIRRKISSCIYIQRRLSREGYNRWIEYEAYEVKEFIEAVLENSIPCQEIQCPRVDKCRRLSNYNTFIKRLKGILKNLHKHEQDYHWIIPLTTDAGQCYSRLVKCARLQKSQKQSILIDDALQSVKRFLKSNTQ